MLSSPNEARPKSHHFVVILVAISWMPGLYRLGRQRSHEAPGDDATRIAVRPLTANAYHLLEIAMDECARARCRTHFEYSRRSRPFFSSAIPSSPPNVVADRCLRLGPELGDDGQVLDADVDAFVDVRDMPGGRGPCPRRSSLAKVSAAGSENEALPLRSHLHGHGSSAEERQAACGMPAWSGSWVIGNGGVVVCGAMRALSRPEKTSSGSYSGWAYALRRLRKKSSTPRRVPLLLLHPLHQRHLPKPPLPVEQHALLLLLDSLTRLILHSRLSTNDDTMADAVVNAFASMEGPKLTVASTTTNATGLAERRNRPRLLLCIPPTPPISFQEYLFYFYQAQSNERNATFASSTYYPRANLRSSGSGKRVPYYVPVRIISGVSLRDEDENDAYNGRYDKETIGRFAAILRCDTEVVLDPVPASNVGVIGRPVRRQDQEA
uniref:Uncharacterized protein n=1 Tax=Mycena chlorophos TaxID=658473 RepID=A0ABQ0M912_MYCCL|nr:predicted protein [Mycena chlorophos]